MAGLLRSVVFCLLFVWACAPLEGAQAPAGETVAEDYSDPLTIESQDGPRDFRVEIADTAVTRQRGMMFRRSMPDDAGMLFDLEIERPISFWMKNTYIPLDLVFIGNDGRIRSIIHSAKPKSVRPLRSLVPVRAVLEIKGGMANKLGLQPGDLVHHRILGTGPD